MMTRRAWIGSLAMLLSTATKGATTASSTRKIFNHQLPEVVLKDWSVTAVEVTYQPGDGTPAHRHPGITVGYVLEGEIRSKVGDAPEQTYAAGQMFIETPGQLHAVSRNASAESPARLLALLFAENGKQLTTPA